ncbi:hypothetical protein [Agaribacter flavus]|uniref:Sel1 repeat family protein n=1 Tax=Agaribacter flavus TaxID=1902781 RepID=A0ABV7FJ58_9ALTE
MRLRLFQCALLLFTFVFVSSSSHLNPAFLLSQGLEKQQPYLLWQAYVLGAEDADDALFEYSVSASSPEPWLAMLAKSGHVISSVYLADNATNKQTQAKYYALAAQQGHARAQFEYALLHDTNINGMLRFLKASAKQAYSPAIIAYAKHLHANEYTNDKVNEDEVLYWLEKASLLDAESAIKQAKRLWNKNNKEQAIAKFMLAKEIGSTRADRYIDILQNYAVQPVTSVFAPQQQQTKCLQEVQALAFSLESMLQAVEMREKFLVDNRMSSLGICLQKPIWLDGEQVRCAFDPKSGRNTCDFYPLVSQKSAPSFSHLVFFVERGKAYVNNGAMYIDLADEYSVFVHELAHFVGFVDEYTLSESAAEHYCLADTAPNLLVHDPISEKAKGKLDWWRRLFAQTQFAQAQAGALEQRKNSQQFVSLTENTNYVENEDKVGNMDSQQASEQNVIPSLSIAPSRSCKKLDLQVFKPSADITFLEHHDTENIPELYLLMWQALLQQQAAEKPLIKLFLEAANQSKDADLIDFWADAYYSL